MKKTRERRAETVNMKTEARSQEQDQEVAQNLRRNSQADPESVVPEATAKEGTGETGATDD